VTGEPSSPDDFDNQLALLETTDDPGIRNQLAMDLAETRRPEVFEALLRLIRRPALVNHRGTLVYSLEGYDCSDNLPLLAELVATGNVEVALGASAILEALEQAPTEGIQRARAILTAAQASPSAGEPDWRCWVLAETLEDLSGWKLECEGP
jgi:hypothetical protein